MNAKAVGWILAAVVAAWAPVALAQTSPYEGVLTGSDVYVRSGPKSEAYPCTKLSPPAKVTVVGQLDTWLKIMPPEGCWAVVRKTDVKLDATGRTATNAGNSSVWVYAAGELRTENFNSLLARIRPSESVEVIGDADGYYKIKPPADAYFWISAQFVRRVVTTPGAGEAEPVRPTPPGDGTVTVGVVPTPDANTAVTGPETPPSPDAGSGVGEVAVPKGMEQFAAAEKILLAEYAKPVAQRNYDSLLETYKAIDTAGDNAHLKKYVDYRLSQINRDITIRKDLEAVNKLSSEISKREQELRLAQARAQSETPTTRPVTAYAAQGILLVSDLFPGTGGSPRRYIIRDRVTYFINAYVQCTTGAVDLDQFTSKYVGISGTTRFDKNLGLDVVEARDVRVLSDSVEGLPTPPRPMVKPMPTPVPVTPTPPTTAPAPEPATMPAVAPTPLVPPEVETQPAPEPRIEVTPEPVTPEVVPPAEPKVESTPLPVFPLTPVEPEPKPVVVPTPIIEPAPAPAVAPAPVVPPAPVVEPETTKPRLPLKPEPVVVPAPKIEPLPEPEPVVVPAPKIEPLPEPKPVVVPAPKVEIVPEPATPAVPAPKIETLPEPKPVLVPAPKVEVPPEPVMPATPIPAIKPEPPVVRFGVPTPIAPATQPAPSVAPVAPTTMPTTAAAPTTKPAPVVVPLPAAPTTQPAVAPVAPRKAATGAEEEFD